MKKNFSIFFVMLMVLLSGYISAQTVITQWTFEEDPFTVSSPVPTTGAGTASTTGMTAAGKSAGSNTGCAQAAGTGAWQIDPASPGTNESNGVQFMVSTAGFENVTVSYDHRLSNTSTRTSRIQYTLDGGATWQNLDLTSSNYTSGCSNRGALDLGRIDASNPAGANVSDSWGRRTIDFKEVAGSSDNPDFGFRVVAAHYSTTSQFRQANNVGNQATAGTWRFDNVTFTGTPKKCIIISEYMYGGANGEFIEFTNVCSQSVDMTGWSFDDDSRVPGSQDLSAFGIVQPGESVILTEAAAESFRTAWGLCEGVKIIGGLTNNLGRNDEINLYDSSNNLVDRLTYGDTAFPGSIRTQNISGWVSISGAGANDPYAWTLSVVDDTEESFTSAGGDIGSPGKSTLSNTSYNPCDLPNCIFITEYMYAGNNGEFIEFTNVCNYDVSMSGWSFDDDSRIPGTVDLSAFGTVKAGESVILTEANAETFRSAWGLCDGQKIIGNLTTNLGRNDEINLYDAEGNLADRLTYGDQAFPGSIRTQNISGYVDQAGLGANNAFSWTLSIANDVENSFMSTGGDVGSPGKSTKATVLFTPCEEVSGPCLTLNNITTTDETCNGAGDGTINISATSDTPVQYSLNGDNFQMIGTFENLQAGLYEVTIYAGEDEGCSKTIKVLIRNNSPSVAPQVNELQISALSQISLGNTEIVAYDPASKRIFSTNGTANKVDIIDFSNPATPLLIGSINISGDLNSVAVKNGIVAIAVAKGQDPGEVLLTDTNGTFLLPEGIPTGALPDMIVFTPDGNKILTANEGEPNNAYTIDPEGSVTIIDISNGIANYTVQTASFAPFNGQIDALREAGVRIFGPNATVAQDMEPEYIVISEDGTTAYVACQENNAIAIIDIATATVTEIKPLGFKDHSLPANAFDPSDQDGGINIKTWPVYGMYQPDAIALYTVNGQPYIISANEGDARVYSGYSEEFRVNQVNLDTDVFFNANILSQASNLGRLRITTSLGDTNGDGKFESLYAYGTRSFSIWDANVSLIYDSGSDFERITAVQIPNLYNSELGLAAEFDQRSDNKGPEPEAVAISIINGQYYAFIGLERTGGVMVYNVNDPYNPYFVSYISAQAGDAAPEDVKIIDAVDSPNGKSLILVANEASGTISIYQIESGCETELNLQGNPQGGSGNYIAHQWQITGGSAIGANIFDNDLPNATLDFSSVISSGTVELTYTVSDANGCIETGTLTVSLELGDISVSGNNQMIENGSDAPSAANHTKFGSTRPNIQLSRTYTVNNTGCSPVDFSNPAVEISGINASNFTVQSMPASTLLPGESTTFTVTFSGIEFGLYEAIVSINSNAANSNPFTFSISAAVSESIIAVRGNAVPIPDGSTTVSLGNFTDFGTIIWSQSRTRQFSIFNLGTQTLQLTGMPVIEISGADADKFTVTTTPANTVLPGSFRQFQIRFDATEPGLFYATVSIANSDLGADPYTFTISANVNFPTISVTGNNRVIANGSVNPNTLDFTDFGTRNIGSPLTRSFYVRNIGNGHLGLTGTPRVVISGMDASQFSVSTQPSALIAPGGSSLLRIVYSPNTPGVHNAIVSIESIDPDNNPYTFAIRGTAAGSMLMIGNNNQQKLDIDMKLFPNPAKDVINIESGFDVNNEPVSCEIFNSAGQLVKKFDLSNGLQQLNIEGLQAGIYTVRVIQAEDTRTSSFVKIN